VCLGNLVKIVVSREKHLVFLYYRIFHVSLTWLIAYDRNMPDMVARRLRHQLRSQKQE
jgi:hypothetical protein